MPRRVRQQVAAGQRAAAETEGQMPEASGQGTEVGGVTGPQDHGTKGSRDEETVGGRKSEVGGQKEQQTRPRQVAVPFRNYRRYRG